VRASSLTARTIVRRWRARKPGWATVAGERLLLRYPLSHFDPEPEAPVLDAFARALRPGMLVFDIGANAGIYTLVAARLGARVVAFEPSRAAAALLREHLALNRLEAGIEEVVVTDVDSEITFYEQGAANTSSISEASARTGELLLADPVVATKRPAVTLDSYCARTDLWPDLVKLDVEGAEARALVGAGEWLGRHSGLLLVEVHPCRLLSWERARATSSGGSSLRGGRPSSSPRIPTRGTIARLQQRDLTNL